MPNVGRVVPLVVTGGTSRMATRLDSRQSRQRALLDQLSQNTDVKLDQLMNLVNDELQMPLRLRQANPSSLVLYVDPITVKTQDGSEGHERTRTIQPFGGVLPSFTGGSLNFPGTSGGNITASGITLATSYTLTVASSQWIKVLLALNTDNQIVLTFGTTGASESAAGLPDIDVGVLPIGYVSMQNVGGTIQNVTGARIYQFAGGGSGAGGSGSGTFKNYLGLWFDAEKSLSSSAGTVSASGNRTALDTEWATAGTMVLARSSTLPLRGKNSISITPVSANVDGSVFAESPVFTLDAAEYKTSKLALYISSVYSLGVADNFDMVLVRYNSSGVFQQIIPIYGTYSNSPSATPPSQLLGLSNTQSRYFGAAVLDTATTSTDKYALRVRILTAGAVLRLEDLYVGPNADLGVEAQRFIGEKQFADGLEAREGLDVPNTLDFTGTLTVAATETKMAGKLDIASGTTVTVNGYMMTVGSITGTGVLNGSGVVVSV